MGDLRKCSLSKLRGDTLWSLSYGAPGTLPGLQPAHGGSTNLLSGSWVFYGGLGQGTPTSLLNPQKAVLTVDAATTQILTGNKAACSLLKVMSTQLSSKQLCNFLVMKKGQYALTEPDVTASGEVVVIAGKVMDLIDNDGEVVPVSVWMRRLGPDSEPRCLVVMEPVQRTTATVVFDADKGKIAAADKNLALLCGYSSGSDLEGMSITELIPALQLPTNDGILKTVRKQQATGRTRDGGSFPLSILIEPLSDTTITTNDTQSPLCSDTPRLFRGMVWVFANISGMITILPDGTIHSCNSNFSLMLFGYTQSQLQGKNITTLIPSFYEDFEFLDTDSVPLPLLDDDEEDSRAYAAADDCAESDSVELCRPLNPTGKGSRATNIGRMSSASLEEMERCLQGLALSTSVTSVKPHVGVSGAFQRSTSAADPLAPLVGPSGECSREDRSGDVNGNVDKGCTDSRDGDRPRSSMKSSISADHLEIRHVHGEGDVALTSPDESSVAKRSPLRQRKRSAEASCSTQLKDLAEEEEDDDEELVISLEPTKLSTSESFHSTSTVTSSTVHSTEENTQEALTGEKGGAVPESALKSELRTFRSSDSLLSISEGSYSGLGRHKDGTDIAILYQIRRVELEEGSSIYCLWVSRDMELDGSTAPQHPAPASPLRSLTLGSSTTSYLDSSHATTDISDLENFKSKSGDESVEPQESEYTSGIYSERYTTLQQIGKGAYGCVKMAYRNMDHQLVITKFIRKSKVYEESWVTDRLIGHVVPLEVSLLTTLSHPNIVRVLDVFENAGYFQMVMEKHGSGMDLFEFIDRSPRLDEPLASYIFRQVVSALVYLHGLRIVHRDVKDENIILDERFCVKLIDFGSAAFMAPDKFFTTFCGTMEYCSPEVLKGEKYSGPELEMWALGITLYTLIFGENPFFDVEETISGVLKPPCGVSPALWELISWLLHRDPKERCTLPQAKSHEWTTQPVCPESYRFEDVVHATPEEIHPSKHFHQDSSIYLSSSLYDINRGGRSLSCGSSQAHLTTSTDKQRNSSELAYDSEDISEELDSCS